MAKIPLSGLPADDPRNDLSEAARRRISDAQADADLIRTRALAAIEAIYRAEPDPGTTFSAYCATGQSRIELDLAGIQAARKVLGAVAEEFRAAGKTDKELRNIMGRELDDAVTSFGFSTIQRDLLWRELALFRNASTAAGEPYGPGKADSIGPKTEDALTAEEKSAAHANGSERRILVDRFIEKIAADLGREIRRKDIWTAAGYKNRTEFERFQREDSRATKSATASFTRVLRMTPEDFLRALEKKTSK